jgi:cell wall-associated NlpC family hydrolase
VTARLLHLLATAAALQAACASTPTNGAREASEESSEGAPSADRIAALVERWLGAPYKRGGSSPRGTDCSGFTQAVMQAGFGIELPRTSREQARVGERVRFADLRPGDLVFFDLASDGKAIDHVGLYAGDGLFAHASPRFGVVYDRLTNPSYLRGYRGARRVISGHLASR